MDGLTPQEIGIIWLSLKVAGVAAFATLPPGIGIAWLLARRQFPGKALLDACVHLPLVLPPVVIGYLLLINLGAQGSLGKLLARYTDNYVLTFHWTGAALASAVMSFPLMVRPLRLSLESADRRLEQAAATLGAGPWRIFFTITLPLAWPGVLAGTVLAFAKALGEFGATITFVSNIPEQTQTLSLAINTLMQTPGGEASIWRLVLVAVAISLAALLLSEALARRQRRQEAY